MKQSQQNFSPQQLFKEFESVLYLFQNSLQDKNLSLHPQQERGRDKALQKIISENSSEAYRERILSEFSGFGPLDPLLRQADISEIIINGKDHIFYEKRGQIFRLEDSFLSALSFNNIVERIGAKARITVNLKKPFNEGRWGPFRVHILCPPVVKGGFHLCLRRQTESLWTFNKLEELGWAPPQAVDLARQFVRDKLNFLIAGPTSSGKTSVLNAGLQELKANERVISIEDTDEIILPNSASAKLLSQTDPESLSASIDLRRLVRQSLRMRPDRIVMGEVRGEEAKDLLLALSTGHRGSIGTIHASHPRQALWKLETLAQMGAPQWQSSTVRNLIFSSLKGILILEKRDERRLLKGIYKITALEPSGFLFDPLFER